METVTPADILAHHPRVGARCGNCRVPWPCHTAAALETPALAPQLGLTPSQHRTTAARAAYLLGVGTGMTTAGLVVAAWWVALRGYEHVGRGWL